MCIALSITACKQRTGAPSAEATPDISNMKLDALSSKFDARFEQLDHVKIGKLSGGTWVYYDMHLHGNIPNISTYTTQVNADTHSSIGKMLASESCLKKGQEVIDAIPDKLYANTDSITSYTCQGCDAEKLYISYTKAVSADKQNDLKRYEFYIDTKYNQDEEVAGFAKKVSNIISDLQYYCKE